MGLRSLVDGEFSVDLFTPSLQTPGDIAYLDANRWLVSSRPIGRILQSGVRLAPWEDPFKGLSELLGCRVRLVSAVTQKNNYKEERTQNQSMLRQFVVC